MKKTVKVVRMTLDEETPPAVLIGFVDFRPDTENVNPVMEQMDKAFAQMPGMTGESAESMKQLFKSLISGMALGQAIRPRRIGGPYDQPDEDGRIKFPFDEVEKSGIAVGSLISIELNATVDEPSGKKGRK